MKLKNNEPQKKLLPISRQAWPDDTMPTVSIICITFNQEKYIQKCLDGLLMQETRFLVEIVVHDDASTDKTKNIISNYCEELPHIFRPIFQQENQTCQGKHILLDLFSLAQGKYLAICDGDDYWTHPDKLQRQINLLESRPDVNLCFHRVNWLDETTGNCFVTNMGAPDVRPEYSIDDLLIYSNFIPSSSAVFRKNAIQDLPQWYHDCPIGDLPLHLIALERSESRVALMDPEPMGVYRRHASGIHSGNKQSDNSKRLLATYNVFAQSPFISKSPAYRVALKRRRHEVEDALIKETSLTAVFKTVYDFNSEISWHKRVAASIRSVLVKVLTPGYKLIRLLARSFMRNIQGRFVASRN